jgi:hypothetical protein
LLGTIVSLSNHTCNKYWKSIALSIDQLGNVICQHLFNLTLIKKDGYKFGDMDQTISYVLGRNWVDGTLTQTGALLSRILNRLDKDHLDKAIEKELE